MQYLGMTLNSGGILLTREIKLHCYLRDDPGNAISQIINTNTMPIHQPSCQIVCSVVPMHGLQNGFSVLETRHFCLQPCQLDPHVTDLAFDLASLSSQGDHVVVHLDAIVVKRRTVQRAC